MHTADLYSSRCSQGSSSAGSVCFSSVGTRRRTAVLHLHHVNTNVSYLSSSFTHSPSLSTILRAPTCSNESPTPMMGENFKTITLRGMRTLASSSQRVLSRSRHRHGSPECFNEVILPSPRSFTLSHFQKLPQHVLSHNCSVLLWSFDKISSVSGT